MDSIVAVDAGGGIGLGGQMLYRLPEDLKRFRRITSGGIVIMGRETLLSLPRSKPLPGRENIVLSRTLSSVPGARVARSLAELGKILAESSEKPAFVIGGESVYRALLPYCARAYVTRIYDERRADRHFPNLDGMDGWRVVSQSDATFDNGYETRYFLYENTNILSLAE